MNKVQNADMYAFLEILVRFSLLELTGKYLTQIKEPPGIPSLSS